MNIYLIGLPGSGKSTLGKQLALRLNLHLVDTDLELIAREGKSIEDIFKVHGEDYFRKSEQTLLHELATKENQLVSTGGGMPCFFDNIDYMNKSGVSIFIDVPPETIYKRLSTQRNQKRPMLENKTAEEVQLFLHQKYEERISYYSQATIQIKGSSIEVNDLVAELKKTGFI